MQRIIRLPQHIISQIAAGEVIERPAFAVKELIENAIDAGADSIEIHIENAGLTRIQVRDNGSGMSQDDLLLSFLPHTTSKLAQDETLFGIKTLGFRGEALSSLASISHMNMQSRQERNPGGTIISIHDGKLQDVMPIGMPIGTIVTVEKLFSAVPARRKFLKSEQTEFRHITETVLRFALSYPGIHFLLTHNKKPVFDIPQRTDVTDRVQLFFSPTHVRQLLPVSVEEEYIRITGFVGHPQIASKQNQKQFLFINNRFVTDRLVSLAVREAFGTLLPASNTPVYILNISLPHELVDVNVHPRKEQVAFHDRSKLFDTVKLGVTELLQEQNLTFRLAQFKQENSARMSETASFAGQLVKETVIHGRQNTALLKNPIVFQVVNTYIVVQSVYGIMIYDQHAVHERILYEDMKKTFTTKRLANESLSLKQPLIINTSILEKQIIEEYYELFAQFGFTFEEFQGNSFILRKIPAVFQGRNLQKIIQELINDIQESGTVPSLDLRTQRMLSFLSCRAAVKAGDEIAKLQMKHLIKTLSTTPNNATCPHGRPTSFSLSQAELNSFFKRN